MNNNTNITWFYEWRETHFLITNKQVDIIKWNLNYKFKLNKVGFTGNIINQKQQ